MENKNSDMKVNSNTNENKVSLILNLRKRVNFIHYFNKKKRNFRNTIKR